MKWQQCWTHRWRWCTKTRLISNCHCRHCEQKSSKAKACFCRSCWVRSWICDRDLQSPPQLSSYAIFAGCQRYSNESGLNINVAIWNSLWWRCGLTECSLIYLVFCRHLSRSALLRWLLAQGSQGSPHQAGRQDSCGCARRQCRVSPRGTTWRNSSVNKECIVKLYRHVRIHGAPPHSTAELSLHQTRTVRLIQASFYYCCSAQLKGGLTDWAISFIPIWSSWFSVSL